MFRKDYLMRQIEMAAKVLAAILAKARSGQPLEALGMFDQAYQPLLGVGARLVPVLSDDQLLLMLKPGGVPDDNRWPALVRLLVTEADLYMDLDQPAEALPRYRKALLLLVELGGGKPAPDPGLALALAGRLRGFHLTVAERIDVASVYEADGHYGDAEDTLFEGLDADSADELAEAAIAFYRRLLDKDDAELEAGNLPREEAEAGLAEVLARPPVP
jgi:tetratricopeptide (TPR) repeat protein